jgi:beta-glucosidase
MPGPTRWRGQILAHALLSKKVTQHTLDKRVREVLELVNRACETGIPENAPERGRNTPETTELLLKVASESVVLLKNRSKVLPFRKDKAVSFYNTNWTLNI